MNQFLSKTTQFLGTRTVLYLTLGILTGFSLFCIEVVIAYTLQAFLLTLGILKPETTQIPNWLPHGTLFVVLVILVTSSISKGILQWIHLYLSGSAAELQKFRHSSKILEWAIYSESANSAYITTLLNENVRAVASTMQYALLIAVQVPTALFLWLWILWLAPLPTLLATLLLLLTAFCSKSLDKQMGEAGKKIAHEAEQLNNHLLSSIKNLLLLQIYGTQKTAKEQTIKYMHRYCMIMLSYLKITGLKYVIPQTMGIFLICIITYASTQNKILASSILITYFYIFIRFIQVFAESSRNFSILTFSWHRTLELAKWWFEHATEDLNQKRKILENKNSQAKALSSPVGWEMQNVSFAYPNSNKSVFNNFNFSILPGQTIVITGASGAGKSTLLYLLLGILKPTQGEILLTDAKDANGANGAKEKTMLSNKQHSLLKSIGYVGPESFLIEGSIYENLLYGLEKTPNEPENLQPEHLRDVNATGSNANSTKYNKIWDALEKAECDFVKLLPQKLQHPITEQGQGLSAGQKQRLSLARALLRNPQVLVLDEATSNLDTQTEERLVQTLSLLKGQRTIIAASHRSALLKIADRVLEL